MKYEKQFERDIFLSLCYEKLKGYIKAIFISIKNNYSFSPKENDYFEIDFIKKNGGNEYLLTINGNSFEFKIYNELLEDNTYWQNFYENFIKENNMDNIFLKMEK